MYTGTWQARGLIFKSQIDGQECSMEFLNGKVVKYSLTTGGMAGYKN
jgi:hypothetical protein